MPSSLGSLVVEIGANVAKFSSDMQAVRKSAEDSAKSIDQAFTNVKHTIASIAEVTGIALAFEAVKNSIEGAIDAAANLENLAARTGAAVEGLSALAAIAKLSGTDTEQLAVGLTKLDKTLSALSADSPKAVAAFASIGLSAKDFVGLSADQAFQKVAVSMARYADGVEKTAAAQLIFGKSGAALIPVLRDTAEAGDLVAVVTAKQAHEAEEYEKTLRKLHLATDSVFRQIGLAALPAMEAFAKAMLEASTSANGLNANVKSLADDGSINTWAESSAKAIAFVVDAFDGVARAFQIVGKGLGALGASAIASLHGEFSQAKQIVNDFASDAEAILGKEQFSAKLTRQLEAARKAAAQAGPPAWLANKPTIAGATTGGGDDKALLDQQLKTMQGFIQAENDLLKQRDEQLKRLYDDNRLSIHDYFAGLQADQEKHITEVSNAYDKEIAAVQDYIKHAELKKEKDAGELKILELQAQQSRAIQAEGAALAKILDEQTRATEIYTAKVAALNVQLLIQQGRTAEAAQIQVESADRAFRARLTAEGNIGGLGQLGQVEQIIVAEKALNDQKSKAAVIEETLNTKIGYVNLAVKTGQIGELEGLARTDAARRAQIDQLERIADEYLRIAHTINDGGRSVAAAEAFKLKIDELAAATDTLGGLFRDMFEKTFAGEFAKVIDGTESISKAFRNMANSIFQQLSQIAAQDIATKIFGTGGAVASTSGGGFLSGAFDWLGKLFGGGKAEGGAVSAGSAYLVGERGPELFMPGRSGSVAAAGNFGGSTTVHVHMPAGVPVTRESASLAGAAAARALAVAHARNN
jgi:hypothetical protein